VSANFPPADRDWLADRWADPSLTVADIAAEAGCAATTVRRWVARHGLPGRNASPIGRDTLAANRHRLDELAEETGRTVESLRWSLRHHGLSECACDPALIDDAGWLAHQLRRGRTHEQIARSVGADPLEVLHALEGFGLLHQVMSAAA
jgi:transposase-like protein